MGRGNRIALGVASNALDRVAIAVIQLALVPAFAIHWGVEIYGAWAMLATIPGLLALSDFGFATAATARMTQAVARDEMAEAQATLHSAFHMVLLLAGPLAALAALGVWFVPESWLPHARGLEAAEARLTVSLLAAYGLAILGGGVCQAVFRSREHYPLGCFLMTGTYVTENGLAIAAVLSGFGPVGAAASLLVGRLAGFLVQWLILSRRIPELPLGLRLSRADVRRDLMRPALAAVAITGGSALVLQGSVIALGAAAGALAVPGYVAARTLSRLGMQLTQMVAIALMPEFAAANARGETRAASAMVLAVFVTALLAGIGFGGGLALFGPEVIAIWTHGRIAASPALMMAMGASTLFGALWNPLSNLMLAVNRQAGFSYAYVTFGGVMVVAIYALARHNGAEVAALCLAALDFIMLLVVARYIQRNWSAAMDWRQGAMMLRDLARNRQRKPS